MTGKEHPLMRESRQALADPARSVTVVIRNQAKRFLEAPIESNNWRGRSTAGLDTIEKSMLQGVTEELSLLVAYLKPDAPSFRDAKSRPELITLDHLILITRRLRLLAAGNLFKKYRDSPNHSEIIRAVETRLSAVEVRVVDIRTGEHSSEKSIARLSRTISHYVHDQGSQRAVVSFLHYAHGFREGYAVPDRGGCTEDDAKLLLDEVKARGSRLIKDCKGPKSKWAQMHVNIITSPALFFNAAYACEGRILANAPSADEQKDYVIPLRALVHLYTLFTRYRRFVVTALETLDFRKGSDVQPMFDEHLKKNLAKTLYAEYLQGKDYDEAMIKVLNSEANAIRQASTIEINDKKKSIEDQMATSQHFRDLEAYARYKVAAEASVRPLPQGPFEKPTHKVGQVDIHQGDVYRAMGYLHYREGPTLAVLDVRHLSGPSSVRMLEGLLPVVVRPPSGCRTFNFIIMSLAQAHSLRHLLTGAKARHWYREFFISTVPSPVPPEKMIACFFREFLAEGVEEQCKLLPSFGACHVDWDGKQGFYPLCKYFLDTYIKGPATIMAAGGIATPLAETFVGRRLASAKCIIFSTEAASVKATLSAPAQPTIASSLQGAGRVPSQGKKAKKPAATQQVAVAPAVGSGAPPSESSTMLPRDNFDAALVDISRMLDDLPEEQEEGKGLQEEKSPLPQATAPESVPMVPTRKRKLPPKAATQNASAGARDGMALEGEASGPVPKRARTKDRARLRSETHESQEEGGVEEGEEDQPQSTAQITGGVEPPEPQNTELESAPIAAAGTRNAILTEGDASEPAHAPGRARVNDRVYVLSETSEPQEGGGAEEEEEWEEGEVQSTEEEEPPQLQDTEDESILVAPRRRRRLSP